jgi:hypothetical protein
MIRFVSNGATTFLFTSGGCLVAGMVAFQAGFRLWADGLGIAFLWSFALAMALYALLAALLVGRSVVRLVRNLRRAQP